MIVTMDKIVNVAVAAALLLGGTLIVNNSPRAATSSTVTPETFKGKLARAQSGDVIRLAPGSYGDMLIRSRTFATPLRLIAADRADPPVFNTIAVRDSHGISMEGLTIHSSPTAATVENSPVLNLETCGRIVFANGKINGGLAVNGVPETAPSLDKTGNVVGWPTGRIIVGKCEDVRIEDTEISSLGRGILLNEATGVVIRGNEIHHLRRTAILGVGRDVLIEKNHIHDFRPWRFGQTPVGDHADFIAFWAPKNLAPLRNIRVIGNTLDAGAGTPVLGMWFTDYTDVEIRKNVLIGTDHQGIVTTNVRGALIADNILNGRALIILREGTSDAVVRDNVTNQVWDKTKGVKGANNRVERNESAKDHAKKRPRT
jgi:nitrous oxidase accessory protein NosD